MTRHRYKAVFDELAWQDDPRDWDDEVKMRIYRAPRTSINSEPDISVDADRAFRHALNQGHSDEIAERAAARYARLFEPQYSTVVTSTLRGYGQGDWWDVVAYGPDKAAVESTLKTFEMWLRGDVWTVAKYEVSVCNKGEEHLELVDSIGGVYAETEEEAIAYFSEQVEEVEHG